MFEGRSDHVYGSMVIYGPYFYSGTLTRFLDQIVLFAAGLPASCTPAV